MSDWVRIDDADLDEVERKTREAQEQAYAALPDALRLQFDEELGTGWSLSQPVLFAILLHKVQEHFKKIVAESWDSYHAARERGFAEPPVLH